MERQEVDRQGNVRGLVHAVELIGRMLRVVRLVRREIEEQRLLAGMFLDKGNDVVGIAIGALAAVEMLVEILVEDVRIIAELAAADRGVPGGLDRLGERRGGAVGPQVTLPGLNHRAARGANGADVRAEHVGVAEDESAFEQFVDVRRLDDRVPEYAKAIRSQIIGEEEDDVGFDWLVIGRMQGGQRSQQQCGEGEKGGVHDCYFQRVSKCC